MNVSCMTNVLKKLAFPLVAGGMLMAVSTATAQDYGDIERIFKFPEGDPKYQVPITSPGETVAFRIRLFNPAGNFEKVYVGTGNPVVADVLNPLMMRVQTGNGLAYAKLSGLAAVSDEQTDLEFTYTVRPGDLAMPMQFWGNAGSTTVGTPYEFLNENIWKIRNLGNSSNAVWRFMAMAVNPDPTFAKANVRLQTLEFESEEWEVQQTTTLQNCLVKTTTGQAVSNNVSFYVWSGDTNIAQIVEQQPGQPSASLTMLPGESQRAFRIYGKNEGQTLIYLSPSPALTPGVTNFITKLVTVTEPPPPTVSVSLEPLVTELDGFVHLSESDVKDKPLHVLFSQAYGSGPVTVRLDVSPAGAVALETNRVTLAAGVTESALVRFAPADGISEVTITPVIETAGAIPYFVGAPVPAKIKIANAVPSVVLSNPTPNPPVSTQTTEFPWALTDVTADVSAGVVFKWSFGDGSTLVQTNYTTSGSVSHIYNNSAAANRILRLEIKDKDMTVFTQVAEMSFTVDLPVATPKLELITQPSASETGGLVRVQFALSQSYAQDVTVQLTVEPPEWTNNIVFQDLLPGQTLPAPITIPATKLVNEVDFDIWYKVLDGNTNTASLVFRPMVVSTPGDPAYYTPVPRTVFIRNTPPQITAVNGQSVNAISNVTVAATMSKTYTVDVKDVAADLGSIRTYWVFSDEPTNVYVAAGTAMPLLGSAKASIDHTFSTPGIYAVRVWAEDKDQAPGASADAYREFYVVVGAPPTVRVRPPSGSISEYDSVTDNDYIVVELNVAPPTGAVYVNLSVAPANTSWNGSLVFDTNSVIFTREELNLGILEKRVSINSLLKDGTRISNSSGFTVTPTVTGSVGVPEFYGVNLVAGVVRVHNENPKIINPKNMDIAGTEVAFSVAQGTAHTFYWDVDDAIEDWNFEPASSNTWYFGDNTTYTSSFKAGSYSKTYNSLGVKTVRFVSRDKDGGSHEVSFNIRVDPAKRLDVTPVGHISGSASGEYAGAAGLGRGIVVSSNAVPVTGLFIGGKYQFSYDPMEAAAELLAIPMAVDNTFDSFMYRWMGEGFPALDLVTVSPRGTRVALEQNVAGPDGQSQATTPPTVNAVFSRELFQADNCGDINGDGIPDRIASSTIWLSGQTLNAILGSDLVPAGRYNGDNDFLPDRDNNADWIIAGLGTYAPVGHTFDAYREIRGYHSGLNRLDFGSDEDFGPGEEQIHMDFGPNQNPYTRAAERPTDPTVDDTDGDGFPDGWEYYFWYNTLVRHITGSRYNPADVATGITIPWEDLYLAFDPLTPDSRTNRDIDNDGLTDREELVIGTNPIHWDTDGDGMCDGWEVLRGLDPLNLNDRDDARDARYNNPDGDYMAMAVVKRDLVTGVDGKTYLQNTKDGSMTAWYRYGTTNATTPIAAGTNVTGMAVDTSIPAVTNQNVLLLHFQVYHEFGFDPRTAWCGAVGRMPDYAQNYPVPDGWFALDGAFRSRFSINPWEESDAANTRPFTAYDEYLLMKFMAANGLAPAAAAPSAAGWSRSTHPKTPDSDATDVLVDGVPDGWELYVMCEPGSRTIGISPWSAGDGVADVENPADPNRGDGLTVRREFSGTDSAAAYASPALYTATTVTVDYDDTGISYQTVDLPKNTITLTDPGWVNKFWPTDPWSKDTDGDGVRDGAELAFNYGGTDNGSTCIAGGGLNPCSVDTDLDALPDGFELQFTHSSPGAADGMDGTVQDADGDATDWDKDGLENYQEYWVQAVRGFRYDITTNDLTAAESITQAAVKGLPMDQNYDPSSLFTQVTNTWDVARYAFGDTEPPLWVMLPVGERRLYVSTDPRDADTDNDSLDDFYEMFHGLNPIFGVLYAGDVEERLTDRVARAHRLRNGGVTITAFANDWAPAPLEMDFVSYPWLTGLQTADPDADGLLTFEEMLQPNQPTPSYHNTDPTPLWLTDSASWESVTARFYNPRLNMVTDPAAGRWKGMFFWPLSADRPSYVFSFEENEGYDTDNDGLSDKDELTQGMGGYGDPQDHDDPIRRQALWFDGTQSAAYTPSSFNYGAYAFRSFTVELWVRPETVTNDVGQVLIERPVVYTGQSDLSDPDTLMRRTFQLGIAADGRAYAMFENAGFHDEHTGTAEVFGPVLRTNEWVHLAARMDGQALTIFVNGQPANSQPTSLIPATGVLNVSTDPASDIGYIFTAAPLVLGSANDSLSVPVWGDFSRFFHGSIDEVRVWDGARANAAIATDFRTRYTKSQETNNQETATGNRLIYHYTFDNLFGAETASEVLQAPRGFEALAVTTNRPSGYQVGWWSALPVASLVYTNYAYVPWIENGIDHLPLGGGRVQNSVYWAEGSTGGATAVNVFPNSNNPYGWGYGFVGAADLVPLGFAFARTLPELWDGQGGSSRWSDTNEDSDHDGLPDWWELSVYGDLSEGWNSLYPDGSGLTAGEKYVFELAEGNPADPADYAWVSDCDHDGLPDWWELLFSLNPNDASGAHGADGDPDGDGLTNYYEYLARTSPYAVDSDSNGVLDYDEDADQDGLTNGEEQLLGSHPNRLDSDDDGLDDFIEILNGLDPADALSPYVPRTLVNDGTGYVSVPRAPVVLGTQADPDGLRANLSNWTISAKVKLTAAPAADVVLIQRLVNRGGADLINYELGIAASTLVPYVRFQTVAGQMRRVNGFKAVETNVWSTLTGRFGPSGQGGLAELSLIQDATVNAVDQTGVACATGAQAGDMLVAVNLIGEIDDVTVWSSARSDEQLAVVEGRTLLFGTMSLKRTVPYTDMTSEDWAAADSYQFIYDSTNRTFNVALTSMWHAREVLSNGEVVLYLPFDDGRWTNAVPNAAGERVAAAEDFVYAQDGWRTSLPYAATLVGGADFSPLANSATVDFPLSPDSPQAIDSDGDGMPDMYEVYYGLEPDLKPDGEGRQGTWQLGRDGDPDGDGLSNLFEYYAGTNPWLKDSDSDGILDPDCDSDDDGLTNLDEYHLGSHPKRLDTDDDGYADGVEAQSGSHPAFSDSQPANSITKSMLLDGTRSYAVPQPTFDRRRFNNRAWTIETWVRPETASESGALISCRGRVAGGVEVVYYELGLNAGRPYVRMQTEMQQQLLVEANGGALPAGTWTHVAGVFDPDKNALTLYLNGLAMVSQQVLEEGMAGSMTAQSFPGRLYIGSAGGFRGNLDELRVWKTALTAGAVVDGIEHLVAAGDVRLACSFRFDDGGTTAEDSAYPIRPPIVFETARIAWPGDTDTAHQYCLRDVVFSTEAYTGTRLESDDYDDDKLPDWWESLGRLRTSYYPVLEDIWHEETNSTSEVRSDGTTNTINTVKRIYTGLYVDEIRSENIVSLAERSASLFELGWDIDYGYGGRFTTVPNWTHPVNGSTQGRWYETPDSAWHIKDVYIEADQLSTAELRFLFHQIRDERSQVVINGHVMRLVDLEPQRVSTLVLAETDTFRDERWDTFSQYFLDAGFLNDKGYLRAGWNRIAVQQVNVDLSLVDSRRYEQFWLTLTVDAGRTELIRAGERWWVYAHVGSMVEPPLDAAGKAWYDPDYGLDTRADTDGDGLSNYYEALIGTNPDSVDSDGDGVLDSHEDYDGDGLQNLLELQRGSDPRLPDTDDDGRLDSADGYVGLSQSWTTNSLQPYIERHLHVSGDGFVQAPLVSRWSSDEGSFTLRLSVRPASLPAGTPAVLAAREVSAGVFNYAILLRTDGRVEVSVTTDTGSAAPQQLDVVSAAAIPVGQWSSIDMVADLGMQCLLLLVNGQNAGSAFGNMSGLPASSGKGLARAYFGSGLNGDLDNIAFYREALSEYQLKRIREEGVMKVATPSLYGCYLFDDGTSAAGVSGMGGWRTGQVQDFACIFWSADDQEVAGFTLRDWERGWFNAGTLHGAQTAVIDTYPVNPTTDHDDDGLPDTWEMTYGFDAYDSTGENGALADPDGDGLSNYAEYLASVVYGFHAVNPRLFSTTQSVSDYFLRTGSLYLGEMFTDHDFMEDAWEDGFAPDKVSAAIYDAHLDNDEDGWSNWAEARFSAAKSDVRPDQVMSVTSAGQSRHELPIPVVEALVRYNGIRSEAAVVVQAYSDPAMDGQPDATFRMATGTGAAGSMPLGDWRPRTVSGTLTPGNVQRGSVSLVFTDSWTGGSMATGFDQDGLLYRGDPIGEYEVIGTIDYASGAYALDLTAFAGQTLNLVAAGATQVLARDQYIDCEQSSVVMNYSYRLVENWPKRLFLGRATTGYLREGLNTFFAFLDSNNNGTWDAGEPCGLPQPAATAIGWDHNEIVIELTDYVQGYLRMAIPSGVRSEDVFKGTASDDTGAGDQAAMEQRVRIVRTGVDGQKRHTRVVLDKVIRTPRVWLNEVDLWAQGDLALDWGLLYVDPALDRTRLSYEVFLGETTTFTNGAVAFFTNTFDIVRAKAVSVAPINGAYVYSARPTFKWRLPAGSETKYPAVAFEMRLGSTTGTLMYESGAMPVPARNANGEFVWEAPIYANTRLPNGQVFQSNKVYAWRVIAMNAKFSDTASNWSDWKYFRLDVNAPMQSSGYGSAEARVKYYGPAAAMLTGRVKVQAYRTASFTGMPEAEYTLAGTDLAALTSLAAPVVNARLYGLQESGVAGSYYLCAYIDHNGNDVRDPWESWGYANHYGVDAEMPYMARAVDVVYSAEAPRLDIVIEDADTDQDWVPDAWEYEQNPAGDFLGLVGPSTGAAGDTEINPYLGSLLSQTQASAFFTALALGTTDLDGDGLGDLNELVLGSDARSASTAGDGYNDGDKTALGLNPADALRLDVTGITLANGLPEVDWSVAVERSGVSTLSLAPEVTYELLYTPSLSNPQWQVVRSGKVALDGVQTLTSQIESAVSVDPAQGFFRVRLQK
ncbi:MAG: LamG domain-containing protein [Lentisphaerae bacterium]|nr:LamG domain-containing protein [Lentisphaerota bacterium]